MRSVDRGLRPSASETCLPAPANFPFGEDQVSSASWWVLTFNIGYSIRQDPHGETRSGVAATIHAMRGFAEVFRLGSRDIHEGLRVTVHQREPGALHLHHDPMTAAERVEDVGNLEFDFRDFARLKRLRLLEAVAKFSAEDIAPHELLVAAHRDVGRVWIWIG